MNNKIPCNNCLLLPICRRKGYFTLLDGCETIRNVLYSIDRKTALLGTTYARNSNFPIHVKELERILNPTEWKYLEEDDKFSTPDMEGSKNSYKRYRNQ